MPTKKKVAKKPAAKKKSIVKPVVAGKPIGIVTHFFTSIKVAIIKFKQPVKTGESIAIRGATTDFIQKIASIQYDHKPIAAAPKGKEVGIKVSKRVREGDEIFSV